MTLKDWLKLNPNHRCLLQDATGDQVRAILKNGDGIDQRIIGLADDYGAAIEDALRTRARLVKALTHVES